MTIVVTGGSGFVGTALIDTLLAKGHTVIVVDRRGPVRTHENLFFIPCDLSASAVPFDVLERTDAIIHLAGTDAAQTKRVVESLGKTANKPPIFIAASSVAYYGPGFERDLDERSAAGTTPEARAVEAHEREALDAERLGCRVVLVRTAPVVGQGGFMAPLLRASKFHIMFRMQRADFWLPWVHINDLVRIYLFALETGTLQGVVNAAAPFPLTYQQFLAAFRKATRSLLLPKPRFVRWPYTDFFRELAVSQKIVPQRLIDKGFAFAYTSIAEAIADVRRSRTTNETN